MAIKTLAVMISEDTYDIAVASLAPGFAANHPKKRTFGHMLVINELRAETRNGTMPASLTFGNTWMSVAQFDELYTYVDEDNATPDSFCEVERI